MTVRKVSSVVQRSASMLRNRRTPRRTRSGGHIIPVFSQAGKVAPVPRAVAQAVATPVLDAAQVHVSECRHRICRGHTTKTTAALLLGPTSAPID